MPGKYLAVAFVGYGARHQPTPARFRCFFFVVKVIYLGDIDFDAPGEATATDILVRQHRTRVRVKRVKDKGSTKKKRKARIWKLPLLYTW